MTNPLVLASQSRYRRKLLSDAGIPFDAHRPDLDEDLHKDSSLNPSELVLKLSKLKAESLRPRFPGRWILGSDQALVFEDQFLNKPGSREENYQLLNRLKACTHQLITGAYLLGPNSTAPVYFEEITTLTMRDLSSEEIIDYVDLDQAWDCAGGYKFEQSGYLLFERVETSDPLSIQGLPLLKLHSWWKKNFRPLERK